MARVSEGCGKSCCSLGWVLGQESPLARGQGTIRKAHVATSVGWIHRSPQEAQASAVP